jgi:cell division protein ZapA (FtsZ GTPase activity inhibitor)
MKRSVTVNVAGQRYTLRTDQDDKTLRAVVSAVDERLRDLQRASKSVDTQQLAVMAALQFAEELVVERTAGATLKREIRARGRALLQLLERQSQA